LGNESQEQDPEAVEKIERVKLTLLWKGVGSISSISGRWKAMTWPGTWHQGCENNLEYADDLPLDTPCQNQYN